MGRLLVKKLGNEPHSDLLTRWIAHHIGRQITIAKSAKGKDKTLAEERCFDAILKLWKHRAFFPRGKKPFENFEGIYEVLQRLNPQNQTPFYPIHLNEDESESQSKETKEWLKNALGVDRAARAMILYSLEQAAKGTDNAENSAWFKEALSLLDHRELSILVQFYETGEKPGEADPEHVLRKKFEEATKAKIEGLDAFISASKEIRETLERDLKAAKSPHSAKTKKSVTKVMLPAKSRSRGSGSAHASR